MCGMMLEKEVGKGEKGDKRDVVQKGKINKKKNYEGDEKKQTGTQKIRGVIFQ